MAEHRTTAKQFFTFEEALRELDALKFAFATLVEQTAPGSYERELVKNAHIGVKHRIDYLYDSFRECHK